MLAEDIEEKGGEETKMRRRRTARLRVEREREREGDRGKRRKIMRN